MAIAKPKNTKKTTPKKISEEKETKPTEKAKKETIKVETTVVEVQEKADLKVMWKGENTTLSPEVIGKMEIVNPKDVDKKHQGFIALRENEEDENYYYVKSNDFIKNVVEASISTKNTQEIKDEVIKRLHELKSAWVSFGTAVLSVKEAKLYKAWGHKTFEEYCEKELKLKQAAVYQITGSTLFLAQNYPDIYTELMEGSKNLSYHAVYLISKKEKIFKDKGKYKKLTQAVLDGKMSTREVQKELKELSPGKEASEELKTWRYLSKEIEKFDKNQLEEAIKLIRELKTKLDK